MPRTHHNKLKQSKAALLLFAQLFIGLPLILRAAPKIFKEALTNILVRLSHRFPTQLELIALRHLCNDGVTTQQQFVRAAIEARN